MKSPSNVETEANNRLNWNHHGFFFSSFAFRRNVSLFGNRFCGRVDASAPTISQAQPANAPAESAKGNGAIRIRNDKANGTAFVDLKQGVRRLTKDVVVTQEGEDFILYADELTHYEKQNVAIARQNLRVESRDSTITGKVMRADFDSKTITLTEDVLMRSHGESDGVQATADEKKAGQALRGEVLHKASSLTCDRIDYNYENQQALLTGNIRMRQGDNFGTCDQIVFDEARNIARLIGNVKFANGKRQTFNVPELTLYIDEDKVSAPNNVNITIPNPKGENADKPRAPKVEFAPAPELPDEIRNDPELQPRPTPKAAVPVLDDEKAAATTAPNAKSEDKAVEKSGDKDKKRLKIGTSKYLRGAFSAPQVLAAHQIPSHGRNHRRNPPPRRLSRNR